MQIKIREDKLDEAMDNIDKRQIIDTVNILRNVFLIKKLKESIPVARAYDFFKRLRNLDKYRKNLMNLKNNLLKKLIRKISKEESEIIRNKLRQWLSNANKIRDNAAKNRIAQFIEESYRISYARKKLEKII